MYFPMIMNNRLSYYQPPFIERTSRPKEQEVLPYKSISELRQDG